MRPLTRDIGAPRLYVGNRTQGRHPAEIAIPLLFSANYGIVRLIPLVICSLYAILGGYRDS